MKKDKYSSRYFEIVNILIKNSLLKKYNKLKRKNKSQEEYAMAAEEFGLALRISFEEMGPSFVKFGQMLSSMSELFPKEVISELEKLQDEVKAFSGEKCIDLIEHAYDKKIDDLFLYFDKDSFAQGSIAQVHKAILKNKDVVAVKVQRPCIKDQIALDVSILEKLAKRFNKFIKINEIIDLRDLVDEFKCQINNEIDFVKEAGNLLRFTDENMDDKYVFTPHLYKEFICENVIVMEFIKAKSIKSLSSKTIDDNGEEIAKRLIYSFTNQIFEHGYFHADPHPGNILIDDNLDLYLTDFGIVGALSERKKYTLLKLFMGVSLNSTRIILTSLIELGTISSDVNTKEFEYEIREYLDRYMKLSLKEIKISDIFNNFIRLLHKYEMKIDRSLLTVGKTVLILESVIEFLDKKSSLIELSRPIAKKLFKRFISFNYLKSYILDFSVDFLELLESTPRTLLDISRKLDENGYELRINKLEDDRIVNLEIEKLKQRQRSIINISSIFVFLVALIVLSIFKEIKFKFIWELIAIASGACTIIMSIYSLIKYIGYDRNKDKK